MDSGKTGREYLSLVYDLCKKNNCTLLYASFFGSRLYGTAVPGKSDTDIKGIYIQNKNEVLLGRSISHLSLKTGRDNERNTSQDVDIDLWSLAYWLLDLLRTGDTGAIDLLFSYSNPDCVLYRDRFMDRIFEEPLPYVNLHSEGYHAYAINQARKYGIRGSRLGIIKHIGEWLDSIKWSEESRLGEYLDELSASFGNNEYCRIVECNGARALFLCGKIHLASIKMEEFAARVALHYEMYGARARDAMLNKGIDWKALSHALRSLFQMQELLASGKIVYPLSRAMEIMEIKDGRRTWPDAEKMILDNLEKVVRMKGITHFPEYGQHKAEHVILAAYARFYPDLPSHVF